MANYLIGLDFGTSQTKVCLLNKDNNTREFIRFNKTDYFLPSVITINKNDRIVYGSKSTGIVYRYFKMAAAEDDDLLKVTFENMSGELTSKPADKYRQYNTLGKIRADFLVILYIAYIYLYIKSIKDSNTKALTGLLAKADKRKSESSNIFDLNLGIPTEWYNHQFSKRKIKFETILLTSIKLANRFSKLDSFLAETSSSLINIISEINKDNIDNVLLGNGSNSRISLTDELTKHNLSVFPESAAGVNYLLKTRRLKAGYYATLDIGAGTSDIAIFKVFRNKLQVYYCSESVEIASNDVYKNYASISGLSLNDSFDQLNEIESIVRSKKCNIKNRNKSVLLVRNPKNNDEGLEFILRKTFYRNHFIHRLNIEKAHAFDFLNRINGGKIIILGGGSNFDGFTKGEYCFYKGQNPLGNENKNFLPQSISDFISQVDITHATEVINFINLLVVALGLTYVDENYDCLHLDISQQSDFPITTPSDRYLYYDLQDAVFQ